MYIYIYIYICTYSPWRTRSAVLWLICLVLDASKIQKRSSTSTGSLPCTPLSHGKNQRTVTRIAWSGNSTASLCPGELPPSKKIICSGRTPKCQQSLGTRIRPST